LTDKPRVKDVLAQLQGLVADMCITIQELDKNNIPTLLAAYKQLNEVKDVVDEIYKITHEQYQKLSYEVIPDAFETNKFDSVKAHGRNFVMSVRINASIPEDMREAGYKWITETLNTPELIKPTVNPRQLSSAVKDYFETNAIWPPEDAIKVHKQRYIAIRKA
jgi:hypothetical protein